MLQPRDLLGRYVGRATASGAVLLVAASTAVTAQGHGGAGGAMGGWGPVGGWMVLWPVVLLGVLALVAAWAVGRGRDDRPQRDERVHDHTDRSDPALVELRERYARGELSEEEFAQRRRTLQLQG
ncbi:SHOCT domain-containing protein [Natronorubrum aibiense]|uniref:SHOCT domain-containing protein n=1 Tax=Natronorubrum aibiense TaxID=348826 RepID=A0A5P9P5C9_9EURY|nr:SHOCT domain-containing protein [Natronorubrum aibiense]QFU83167.1 SHOCT domain-containing protein [Natronorubrum aibiense]